MSDDRKIEYAKIEPDRIAGLDLGMRVVVQFEGDGDKQFEGDGDNNTVLFTYYPDELTFTAAEFIGLTYNEAMKLRSDRDIAYLRS